ncbi:PadR family transcriptional regulator [Christensenellaceae bacterium OttesenSCG-928-L17]|nr:PadR family transcriptional regulator [Christensenellaceae bacterium OttesenSCG-928-L17]
MARKQLETLTEQMFYILLSLYRPRHGYAIMQHVLELTEGRVRIGAGTLYTLISRFVEEGYIVCVDESDQRKEYHITDAGKELFLRECNRLELQLRDAEAALRACANEGETP